MSYLLAISIGPVQDFIAAGRKTRDLWFGSFLLGEVSREVAKSVKQQGGRLIFPSELAVDDNLPVANKILAWLDPGLDPAEIATQARVAAQGRLRSYRSDVEAAVQRLLAHERRGVDMGLLDAQFANFLEFAAAWHPVDDETYKPSREEVELLLAGRKALRDFAPAHGVDGVAKSALDPGRESVIRAPTDTDARERLRRRLRLKGAEQLDGVSLIKRLAEPRRFVSVSRVAIDPFIRRAQHEYPDALRALATLAEKMANADHPSVESFKDKLDHGLGQYRAFPFDTQLFYDDERGDPDLRGGRQIDRDRLNQASQFFQDADALRDRLGISEMPTYFAVLVADGDHMGAAISAMDRREDHLALSTALAGFADIADEVVRGCQGAMVYSGGDDVLAFLPLDRALDCADQLREWFSLTMNGKTGKKKVSLSVGVAIGHYGEHLQRLLEWGREAERAAKAPRDPRQPEKTSRNALAVSLHTRGAGEGRTVVHPWSDDLVPGRWNRWVEWHRCEFIPDSAAYELSRIEREFRSLWPKPDERDAAADARRQRLGDLLDLEVRRVLGRRRAQRGAAMLEKERLDEIAGLVGRDLDALRRLTDELLIARRIAAATTVAEGKPAPAECGDDAASEGTSDG